MAGLKLSHSFRDVVLSVGSWKSVASWRAPGGGGTNDQMVRLSSLKLAASGQSGDAEALGFRIARVQAGTGTGTSQAPQKLNNALTAVPRSTCRHTFTAEPTDDGTSPYLFEDKFHPQGGDVQNWEFDDFLVKEGTEVAVQIIVPTGGTAIKVSGHIIGEE